MKLRKHLNPNLIRPATFNAYEHPWYLHLEKEDSLKLNKPNPPTPQAVERAKFIDKTYQWSGNNSIRSGNKRTKR
ncbi:hypothetical protein CMK18_23745 [Candidatus Poribacteria bacterium]|nr:hypothetical protein [Candidatus Poribacteria bacterium]